MQYKKGVTVSDGYIMLYKNATSWGSRRHLCSKGGFQAEFSLTMVAEATPWAWDRGWVGEE
jgi:hypothetical protein